MPEKSPKHTFVDVSSVKYTALKVDVKNVWRVKDIATELYTQLYRNDMNAHIQVLQTEKKAHAVARRKVGA